MKRRGLSIALLALLAALLPSGAPRQAAAQETITLRIATLAPRGSSWMRVFDAWNNSLRRDSGGRLALQFYPGGAQGNESEVIRKIRLGQLDGGVVTSAGLGVVARPLLVLQAPGLFAGYAELDRARTALRPELTHELETNGMHLVGWSDVGQGRIFSVQRVQRPSDLREMHPWIYSDDQLFGEFLGVIGVQGVRLGIPDVLPALASGRIDVIVASATAASALQWHTRVHFVTRQPNACLVGATIVSKARFDALSPDLQEMFTSTANQAHEMLQRRVREDDDRYYEALTTRHGLTATDVSAFDAEWRQTAEQTRARLVGRLFSRELVDRVTRAAHGS